MIAIQPRSPANGFPGLAAHLPRLSSKRIYDFVLASAALIILSPVLLLIAVLLKLTQGSPIFYRQTRVGRHGKPFQILKFRTMTPNADKSGPAVTKQGDSRVTHLGRILRKAKLDELPQLWNVLTGEMSLVGPRPEVPRYVDLYTAEQRRVLNFTPGITDPAAIQFRGEEALLSGLSSPAETEEFYLKYCLPQKVRINQEYGARANRLTDTIVLFQTVCPFTIALAALYALLLIAAFGTSVLLVGNTPWWPLLPLTMSLQLACLAWQGQFRSLPAYFDWPDFKRTAIALGSSCALLAMAAFSADQISLGFIFLNGFVSLALLTSFRLAYRHFGQLQTPNSKLQTFSRIAIIGANTTGSALACALTHDLQFKVTALFDDDGRKWHKTIHSIPVVGMPECLLQRWREFDEVILAAGDLNPQRVSELLQLFKELPLKIRVMHSLLDTRSA